jgi:hypothetical protein
VQVGAAGHFWFAFSSGSSWQKKYAELVPAEMPYQQPATFSRRWTQQLAGSACPWAWGTGTGAGPGSNWFSDAAVVARFSPSPSSSRSSRAHAELTLQMQYEGTGADRVITTFSQHHSSSLSSTTTAAPLPPKRPLILPPVKPPAKPSTLGHSKHPIPPSLRLLLLLQPLLYAPLVSSPRALCRPIVVCSAQLPSVPIAFLD